MKKLLILFLMLLITGTFCFANSFSNTLNKIEDTLYTIDRTESVFNRINNKVNRVQRATTKNNTSKTTTQTTTPSYSNTTSTTQNSYQTTQTYGSDDLPEYTIKQDNNIQSGNDYNQDRVYTGEASTLKELPAGTIVMEPKSIWKYRWRDNYSGEIAAEYPVFWIKLEDGHYTPDSTLLLSLTRVTQYPFCHVQKGLRAWDESDVRRFLRTTFYNHLSEGFKNAIVNVNIPFADMSGNPKTVSDNFFLLSIVEWGLSDRANNGSVIKYDDLPKIYASKNFLYSKNTDRYSMYYTNDRNYTRTINRPMAKSAGYEDDVFIVTHDGVLRTNTSSTNWNVRPAVNLKSSTKVKGPYKFNYNISDTLIYYVIDVE